MSGFRTLYLTCLFLLAFFAQLLLFRIYQFGTASAQTLDQKPDDYIEVVPIELKDLDQSSAHQIIELPPGPDQQPDSAKYLSERAMKADRETVAPPGKPIAGHSAAPVSSQNLFQKPPAEDSGDLTLAEKLKPEIFQPQGLFQDQPGSIDFLEGAASGQITLANSYKYQYAYFFNQLKRSIAFYWNPGPSLRLVPATGADLVTKARFVLNQDGLLKDLEVLSSSGFQAVDRAALSAIKNSTPVFSVPKELLDENGQLSIICEFRILTR